MDPLVKIPEEIHEQFLSYFTPTEAIQTLSLVSKSWYNAVATSQHFMKRVQLSMHSKRKNDFKDRVESLEWMSRKDGRPYQHVRLNCLLDIRISAETWTFLMKIADSIITLNIRSIKLEDPDQVLESFDIPNLEELRIMFVPRQGINVLLSSTTKLKTLILRNEFALCYDQIDYTPKAVAVKAVKDLLERNPQLSEIEVQGRPNVFAFFHRELKVAYSSVKLKKFTVKIEMAPTKIEEIHTTNLIKFLTAQADNLEYLYIDRCGLQVIEHCFAKMPKLEFLRLDIELIAPDRFSIKDLNLQPNENIKRFELAYVRHFDDLKDYFDLLPNVEQILISNLNPRCIDYFGNHLDKLKLVQHRYDECAGGHAEAYNVFKIDNPQGNQNMQFELNNDFL